MPFRKTKVVAAVALVAANVPGDSLAERLARAEATLQRHERLLAPILAATEASTEQATIPAQQHPDQSQTVELHAGDWSDEEVEDDEVQSEGCALAATPPGFVPLDVETAAERLAVILARPLEELFADWRGELDTMGDAFSAKMSTACDKLHEEAAGRLSADEEFSKEFESVRSEIEALREQVWRASSEATTAQRAMGEEAAGALATLAEHTAELARLRGALSGDCSRLMEYVGAQRAHDGGVHTEPGRAEWLLREVLHWRCTLPRGTAVASPPFGVDVEGHGHVGGLRLKFYPNGTAEASGENTCSLFLEHPEDMPWLRYDLSVGGAAREALDPLFRGADDFCDLEPQLAGGEDDVKGERSVRLAVRFHSRERRPAGDGLLGLGTCG